MWVNLGLFSIFKRIKIVYLFRCIKNDSQNYGSSLECTLDTWAENSRCYRCTWAGVFNPRQFSKLNWITVKNLNWAKYYPAVHSKFIQIFPSQQRNTRIKNNFYHAWQKWSRNFLAFFMSDVMICLFKWTQPTIMNRFLFVEKGHKTCANLD